MNRQDQLGPQVRTIRPTYIGSLDLTHACDCSSMNYIETILLWFSDNVVDFEVGTHCVLLFYVQFEFYTSRFCSRHTKLESD
jgi:hypothetical protein